MVIWVACPKEVLTLYCRGNVEPSLWYRDVLGYQDSGPPVSFVFATPITPWDVNDDCYPTLDLLCLSLHRASLGGKFYQKIHRLGFNQTCNVQNKAAQIYRLDIIYPLCLSELFVIAQIGGIKLTALPVRIGIQRCKEKRMCKKKKKKVQRPRNAHATTYRHTVKSKRGQLAASTGTRCTG